MSSTPTPTPGALSAEICRYFGVEARQDVQAIIDRHTARPDVDALVKALEDMIWEFGCETHNDMGEKRHDAIAVIEQARTALARHAKGGATG